MGQQDGIRTTLLVQAEALVAYSTMVTVEPPAMIGTDGSVGSYYAKNISPLPPKRTLRATAPMYAGDTPTPLPLIFSSAVRKYM